MATPSDITVTPLTGLNHIDALLDKGPDWNFLSNNNANVLFYTFSITAGNENGRTGQEAFSASQQTNARTAFSYLQQVTGIQFQETTSGTSAQFHLANLDLDGAYTTGLNSWISQRSGTETTLTAYNANAYVYLDNVEWRGMTQNLTVGTQGYETLLHELGHALGLKHPFAESGDEGLAVLPGSEDNTSNTIMSYTSVGGWHSTYRPYDIAALNWLYGGDGLRGELGINSTTGGRYLTGSYKDDVLNGTQFNDTLQGNGGNDMIDGGAGTDTVIFNSNRGAYAFSTLADGALAVSGADGTDTLRNVEWLQFADMRVERANVAADMTAPSAPVMAVTQNGANYATTGNILAMNGSAEANSTVKVYIGDKVIATTVANAAGLWSVRATDALPDALGYRAFATATDAAGNVSGASNQVLFHIDSTPPSVPTMNVALAGGGNRPVFTGTGEAGSMIELYRDGDFTKIGTTKVGADGNWAFAAQPLPNGNYNVIVASVDGAGNARAGQLTSALTINNNSFQAGTAGADQVTMNAGSNAFDGGAGLDVAVYGGAREAYTIKKETWGHSVTAPNGDVDGLFNVERIKFDNGWKAIDDTSAQIFRLYAAVLDRPAEEAGLGYWNWRMDGGTSLQQVAAEFMKQTEFYTLYGQNPTDERFIEALYLNVLGREPDVGGQLYWSQAIGQNGRAQTLIDFAESPENQALVIDTVGKGLDFIPYA
jgi:serralysin